MLWAVASLLHAPPLRAASVFAPAHRREARARVGDRAASDGSARGTRGRTRGHRGLRIAVSLAARELDVIDGTDTVLVAPVAVGMGTTLRYGRQAWTFRTPRGHRTVLGKEAHPVWTPPEWHYAETAKALGLKLAHLPETGVVAIGHGRQLTMSGGRAGVIGQRGVFEPLPIDEEIIFRNTLYVPPPGSANRRMPGELGRYRLDLGDGYQLHGTPDEESVGSAATHGCLRLYAEDLAWLYRHIPVGTPVDIY